MSKTKISGDIRLLLAIKAGGRCEFEGCNKQLYVDEVTKMDVKNFQYAHIIADSENGPRGGVNSKALSKDITNLMLLCPEHHRLIDHEGENIYSIERLREMKKKHEERVESLTALQEGVCRTVVLYGANIGDSSTILSSSIAADALLPAFYPSEKDAIELSMKNSVWKDKDEKFWELEEENLTRMFEVKVFERIRQGLLNEFALFALAPMPLLVRLGVLLSDKYKVDVYQKHREPDTWKWFDEVVDTNFIVHTPEDNIDGQPALVLSISAAIGERVRKSYPNFKTWELTIENPNNDWLRTKMQLADYRKKVRELFSKILLSCPNQDLHVFMAVPVACAIELGRVWMPKADLSMRLYDYQNGQDVYALKIANE